MYQGNTNSPQQSGFQLSVKSNLAVTLVLYCYAL